MDGTHLYLHSTIFILIHIYVKMGFYVERNFFPIKIEIKYYKKEDRVTSGTGSFVYWEELGVNVEDLWNTFYDFLEAGHIYKFRSHLFRMNQMWAVGST